MTRIMIRIDTGGDIFKVQRCRVWQNKVFRYNLYTVTKHRIKLMPFLANKNYRRNKTFFNISYTIYSIPPISHRQVVAEHDVLYFKYVASADFMKYV
jgi:hypothetical protein